MKLLSDKINVIAIASKSGVGKSTLADLICKDSKDFHYVKSKSSREPRNQEDLDTHIFTDLQEYETDLKNKNIIEEYYNANLNYYNWVTFECFDKTKYNVFVIDIKAGMSLIEDERFNVKLVYLYCSEKERYDRLLKRGENVNHYKDEPHLALSLANYVKYKKNITIIDVTNLSPYQTKHKLYTELALYLRKYIFMKTNGYYFEMLGLEGVWLSYSQFELNIIKLLDYILEEYNYYGLIETLDKSIICITYNGEEYSYSIDKNKKVGYETYNQFIYTILKWKCGVVCD